VSAQAAAPAQPSSALREVGAWRAARELELDLSAGTIRIVPGTADRVRVLAPTDVDHDDNVDLRATYSTEGEVGRLRVSARDELVVTVEVPPTVSLGVKMSAGRLDVGPIAGDKDLQLKAGELIVRATEADHAADADLHVTAGEIQWQTHGVRRGGLLRSYWRSGTPGASGGASKLHARVLAGELRIL
jgi:hypothetical protein